MTTAEQIFKTLTCRTQCAMCREWSRGEIHEADRHPQALPICISCYLHHTVESQAAINHYSCELLQTQLVNWAWPNLTTMEQLGYGSTMTFSVTRPPDPELFEARRTVVAVIYNDVIYNEPPDVLAIGQELTSRGVWEGNDDDEGPTLANHNPQ